MRQPREEIVTNDTVVKCDGGSGPLGHPAVFLNLEPQDEIVCPYCSRYFVKKACLRQHH
ncbi:MAG TPA: zinc-finger domain-containing protein [Holosporales bacterium]|nr:zinc-finger domain-containing protein [Holosporales bacterium]HBW24524.1 zinc-finger domain-containing protein [Holosporales bacterium]HCC24594.1 zinc-finger domain-containing protein [Holosporales bacterium]HCE95637.1 zinc-finger domain-containing protein [Holosporales bacterium]